MNSELILNRWGQTALGNQVILRESHPRFSAARTVREYTELHYLPSAATYLERANAEGAGGGNIVNWEHTPREKWGALHFGAVKVETNAAQHVFEAEVYLDGLDPNGVQVQLCAEGINGGSPTRQAMTRVRPMPRGAGRYVYSAAVSAARAPGDYTARVIPHQGGVAIPLEDDRILWQR